jgi:hypothetical protein
MTEALQQVLTSPEQILTHDRNTTTSSNFSELVVEFLSWVSICSGEVRTCCSVSVMGKYLFRRS